MPAAACAPCNGCSPSTSHRPKWVIQRFRILDAAGVAHSGERIDWSALAYELGFSDQAHLTRVFTHVVGTPPATYQRTHGLL